MITIFTSVIQESAIMESKYRPHFSLISWKTLRELAKNLSGSHNINLGINSAWNDDKITPIPRNRIVPEIKKLLGIDRLIIIIAVVFFLIGNKNQTMG